MTRGNECSEGCSNGDECCTSTHGEGGAISWQRLILGWTNDNPCSRHRSPVPPKFISWTGFERSFRTFEISMNTSSDMSFWTSCKAEKPSRSIPSISAPRDVSNAVSTTKRERMRTIKRRALDSISSNLSFLVAWSQKQEVEYGRSCHPAAYLLI
jgi:hypothetical protein